MQAAIGAGASLIGSIAGQQGANQAAGAAQDAALAQQAEAKRQFGELSGITNRATVAGLKTFDTALSAQEKALGRQEQLISQIDPTLIEASQQALKLLRGEQASTLGPLKQQRDQQRQKLLNSLREQLGPGAETSTAGIQALTRFDQETSNVFAGAQQQALGQLGSTFGQFSQFKPSILGEARGLADLGRSRADLQFDQARLLSGFGQPLLQSAGAEFTGDALRGQAQQALGGQLTGFGLSTLYSGLGEKLPSGESSKSTRNPYTAATSGGFFGELFGGSYSPETAANLQGAPRRGQVVGI